jgi:DNA-binding transcriptional LysR family regulator
MDAHLAGMRLRGRLRFGACEDFVLGPARRAGAVASRHPDVDVALTVGLSETLYDQFDAGQLDIMLVKKRPDRATRGDRLARDGGLGFGGPISA